MIELLILKLRMHPYLSLRTFRLNFECFRTIIYLNEVFASNPNKFQFRIEEKGESIEQSVLNAHNELIRIINCFIKDVGKLKPSINYNSDMTYAIKFQLKYLKDARVDYRADALKGKIKENVELVRSNLINKLNSIKESIS